MKYKSIIEQCDKVIQIIKQNKDLMKVLDYIGELDLPNFYITSGSLYQTIWNYYDGKDLNYHIKDIDVVYYDSNNLSIEDEKSLELKIINHCKKMNINYNFDVHNEARMHLWKKENEYKNIDSYENSEDAICKWIATVQAIGITKTNGNIKIYAPYGLSDIFSKTIRPIKSEVNDKDLYNIKVESLKERFDGLKIVEW